MKSAVLLFVKKVYFIIKQRVFRGRLKYFYVKKRSNILVVVFSGFPADDVPRYNYVRTLKDVKVSQLFILDDFGHRGSYYLLEKGSSYPAELTESLINRIVNDDGYKTLIIAGSSKGGTAAIYFGLQCNASEVYAGACQYYIGDYLSQPEYAPIVMGMTGREPTREVVDSLNNLMPLQLRAHTNSNTIIHLLYSRNEHTYKEHIIGLIADLRKYGIPYDEVLEHFADHNEVGKFFSSYLKDELSKIV